jgi:GGDEF domain-containing protein
VVLCEDITPPQARQVVDRITATFAEPFHLDAGTVTVTASVGLQLSEPGMDARRLVGSADEAMYEAKRAGRAPVR